MSYRSDVLGFFTPMERLEMRLRGEINDLENQNRQLREAHEALKVKYAALRKERFDERSNDASQS